MESKASIDSKIGADAMNSQGSASAGNLNVNVTNANPLLKDSKRVIKKMIVMDTSKLKGLGIESTIKNAMSKLGKGKNSKMEKPTFKPVHASPKIPETIVKTEPNNTTVKIADTVIKHIHRPGVPLSTTSNSTTDQVPTQQPKSMTPKPLIHHVVHLPRQSISESASNILFQSAKAMAPPAPVIKNVAQSACVPTASANSAQPVTITSPATVPDMKGNRNVRSVPSQINNPVIKVEGAGPSAASDGKKIKVLSNVSLIDGKSKLLEIDKLTSKNLKFTNVIKGTDHSPPKPTVHPISDSGSKTELPSHSNTVPVKAEGDKGTKFTHVVVKGSEARQPRTIVSTPPNITRAPAFTHSSVTKPIKTDVKLTSSMHLKPQNVHGTTKLIFHGGKQHLKPSSTPVPPIKIEEQNIPSRNVKMPSTADGTNKTIPSKILNFSYVIGGNTSKSDLLNQSARLSHPAPKPIKTGVGTIPSKNLIFTNASRPIVQIITTTKKYTTPPCPSSVPIKTEPEEPDQNNFNQPNNKPSKEFALHNMTTPPVCKVAKPVTAASSTSAATEVATKQLVTTDENIEIQKPCAQKYLIKGSSSASIEQTAIADAVKSKRLNDAVWSTNNPRTYARHNIKRLLSDKIIKKSRPSEESVQNVHIERTSETLSPLRMDLKNDDASTVSRDSKSEKEHSKTEPSINQSTACKSELTPVNDPVPTPTKLHDELDELPIQLNITTDSDKVNLLEAESASLQPGPKTVVPTVQPTPTTPVSTVQPSPTTPVPTVQPGRTTPAPTVHPIPTAPVPTESDSIRPAIEPMDVTTDSEEVKSVSLETEPIRNQSTPSTAVLKPVDDLVQLSTPPVDVNVNVDSVTVSKNDFYGFSSEEVNASFSVLSLIKAILSKRRPKETVPMLVATCPKDGNETEIKMVGCDSWILNHETGVLEQKIDKTVKQVSIQQHVPPATPAELDSNLSESNLANKTTPKDLPSAQMDKDLESSTCGLTPSKIPVIEDADDEISDIDLFHRSKTKCAGNTMNRRAIFKSMEMHRKSVLPATTDDDEPELSLSVRPPRPKLRRSRQKQTLEQLKVQQNAHVSLLKRFVQTDSDYDRLNDEVLMSFVDSVDQRIEVLEDQVKCCFKRRICEELNFESMSLSEQGVFVDLVKEIDGSVIPGESVTKSNEPAKSSESPSNIHRPLSGVVNSEAELPEPIIPSKAEIAHGEHRQGQLTIHEVTIQRDTFLVTEYDDQCDKINHLPLNVKLEKDSSTKPSTSAPVSKTTKPTIRKKRKRKSLIEMLAKHVDKETLKSVIIAHAKQKCGHSSSPDSESDSDSDRADVVSKIFRTVCTIDLCDDDDETLHEDVLQYLKETNETEMETEQDTMPVTSSYAVESNAIHKLPKPIEPSKSSGERPMTTNIEPRTLEPSPKIMDACSTTMIDTRSEETTCENPDTPREKVTSIPAIEHEDTPVANLCTEMPSTLATSSISVSTETASDELPMETESNSPNSFDDDYHMEMTDSTVDVVNSSPPEDNSSKAVGIPPSEKSLVEEVPILDLLKEDNSGTKIADEKAPAEVEIVSPFGDQSKMEEIVPATITKNTGNATEVADPVDHSTKVQPHTAVEVSPAASSDPKLDNTSAMKSPKRAIIKLRPIEEISCRPKRDSLDNDFVREPSAGAKLSFGETLNKVDSVICKETKSKRKHTALKSKNVGSNSVDTSGRLIGITPEKPSKPAEKSSQPAEQSSKGKVQYSSVSVTDDSAVGAIKIKIKIEKNSQQPNNSTSIPNNNTVNGVPTPSRSRKRKSAVLDDSASVAMTTPLPTETSRKRPMFDYFDSPEILTTKRARKSKSYVDDDESNRIENVPMKTPPPSNPRTSRRKSNISKSSAESDLPKSEATVQKNVEEANDDKDMPATEPVTVVMPDPNVESNVSVALTTPRTGRGIRPPVLAPINVADQYVCGNCKEDVTATNWTKHVRGHYGLAWRVDVDPPIDMDNIHSMSSKVFNFIKKANIKILKCPKCDVEKKSALGYLSHLEVCGLTPEEAKSKLVKCEHCPSMIRSCSMKIHLTFCAGLKRLLQKEEESTKVTESPEECYNDMGRAVRRSAQKAMSSFKDLGKAPVAKLEDYVERVEKISNKQHRKWRQLLKENPSIECVRIGCEFTTDDLVSMVNHFNSCVLVDGETFYCNRCEHGPDTRAVIEEHIKASHTLGTIESIDDKVFSDSDDDAELGEESSESDGESGDEEISDKNDRDSEFDDEDDDGWNAKGCKKKRRRDWAHNEVMLNSCLDRKVLADYAHLLRSHAGGSYYYPTLEWTQDFRDTHFSNEGLLPSATPNTFSVLCSTLTDSYLPKIQQSNKFLVKEVRKYRKVYGSTEINESDSWDSLKRFEATKESDCLILFTGGPVLSMAWLPVPDDHLSQLLAVCCRSDANDDILLNNTKPVKCLIQIWNFHKLRNGQLREAQIPHLLYSVAYDHGPVIQMEFCPSGGFTEDRLGLLAVSSYDGHVDILALPKNFTCDNSKIENLVFTIEPSLTLCCERDRPFGVLMTKLVWSQSKGHSKLAGGFANGLVAIWNLKNLDTPYTCSKINGIPTLLPTDLFFAGNKTIKLLEFHHDENSEARWLIAGSHDRKVKFFDTHNVYIELSTTVAHSRIVAGCWPIHWTSFLLGIDNAYSLKTSGIIVKQPLDIGCRTSTFYSCIGSTCDISFNNWLNSYVFVTSYGDIHVGYVRQMLSGFGETRRQRSILSYTDSVDISRSDSKEGDDIVNDQASTSDEPQPSTSSASRIEPVADVSYPSADGIVFCDFRNPLPVITSPSYEKIEAPPMSTFNMVKVNRVVFNPNVSAYKLYALGYESGFVRIIQLLPK